MEKSIESIWNEGFLNNEILVAPKLNNLYNKKSNLLIEKIRKTYTMDNKSIIPIAVLFAAGFSYAGHVALGLYGMTLMIALFFLNRTKLQKLERIKITSNSYQYLLAYKNIVKELIGFTTKLLALGLPIAVIPSYWLFFRKTELFQQLILKTETLYLILIVIGLTLLISLIGVLIYKFSTAIVYGNLIKKLDEIIGDMEALRK